MSDQTPPTDPTNGSGDSGSVSAIAAWLDSPDHVDSQPRAVMTRARPPRWT